MIYYQLFFHQLDIDFRNQGYRYMKILICNYKNHPNLHNNYYHKVNNLLYLEHNINN